MLNIRLASNSIDLGNEVHLRAMLFIQVHKKIRRQENKQRFFLCIYYHGTVPLVLKLNLKSKCCFRTWASLEKMPR